MSDQPSLTPILTDDEEAATWVGVGVRRAPRAQQWLLHCDPDDASALGLDTTMLRAEPHGTGHALHLAPDEWLLIGVDVADFAASPVPHALVDVSERTLGMDLAGPLAAAALNAGCPLDLGDAAFPVGACTRTLFGKVTVMLWRHDAGYRIQHGRSFDAYVAALLALAVEDACG